MVATGSTAAGRRRTGATGSPRAERLRAVLLAVVACALLPAGHAAAAASPAVPGTARAAATAAAAPASAAPLSAPVWTGEDGLREGGVLPSGYGRTAANGSSLVMQTDGNLVLYRRGVALWSTLTDGNPGAYAAFQTDGNLVVYRPGPAGPVALWASGTAGARPVGTSLLLVVEDRELSIVYGLGTDGPSGALWGSGWTSDRLVAGDELRVGDRRTSRDGRCVLLMQADRNLVEYCDGRAVWATGIPGSSYPYAETRMQADGNAVVYVLRNPSTLQAHWASGTRAPGSSLLVQDDRNVVVYAPDGRPTWSRTTGRLG